MEQFLRAIVHKFEGSYIDNKIVNLDINNKYNIAIRSLISFFAVNFLYYFPNFFSTDELLQIIFENLDSIKIGKMGDSSSIFGSYRSSEKRIKINKDSKKKK